MDKSELFIKQCDCPEIQGQKPDGGTEISYYKGTSIDAFIHVTKYGDYWALGKNLIWLPMQHQIQKMCKERHLYYSLKNIQRFQVKHTIGCGITSWEQLWLAFYMYEEHGKVWSLEGGKWLKRR